MAVVPNFFMVGSPKCGTTAMSEYLRTHPGVFLSDPKEPSFFAQDVVPARYRTIDEYLALFASATPQQRVVGEASTSYIYAAHALESIRELSPNARLLAMLRRPVDLIYAQHAQLLKAGQESEFDFEKAWALWSDRSRGKAIPPSAKAPQLNYRWIGSLGSQVDRLLRIFPREQVHFILFDDFVKDTRAAYLGLLQFLELPDDGRVEFPRVNEGIQFKSRFLARFPRYLRAMAGSRLPAIKKRLGVREIGFVQRFDRINAEKRPRPPLRPEFRRYLQEQYNDEILLLERLIGRDLSAWRAPVSPAQ